MYEDKLISINYLSAKYEYILIIDVDQFVDEQGQLNVEQIEKYLSNEEQSPDRYINLK